ncbi:MAG: cupin, partial [Synechococcaceae bacterium WB9_2_170]|nr:cupin [Synechococcaceae bacterium WB9_2_170]
QRIDWQPGGAFLTPPGWWHSHVNPTDTPARLLPVQDAGLHSYLRSLDIQFR